MRRTTLILAAALTVGVTIVPGGALAQEPPPTSTSSTTSTPPPTTTSTTVTTAPPTTSTTAAPSTVAPPTVPPPASAVAAPEGAATAPKLRGVGDSVFYSAQSKVVARLQPEYRPRFRSALGATIAEMTSPAREMTRNAQPAVMVLGLGNPDIAEMDSGLNPYPAATQILGATFNVPCVVWVNVKERGVNTYYNRWWQQHATAFNSWLVRASQDGPGNDLYVPNLHILDWNQATVGHPSWFLADGLHLNATGQANYARKIDRFVNRVCAT